MNFGVASMPIISVVMPVHNNAGFLVDSVDSVLRQTFEDFELLIIDDGSTDGSGLLIRECAATDARVKVFRQENRGIAAALNCGIRAARGKYVARIDADDRMLPVRLERQLCAMQADPALVLLGSAYREIGVDGRPGAVCIPPLSDAAVCWKLLFQNALAHPAVMLRRSTLMESGLEYDEAVIAEDYDLWSKLSEHGRVRNLREPLIEYRVHPEQATQRHRNGVAESAVQIARWNLGRLGFDLEPEDIRKLIDWQSRFPRRIDAADAVPALGMFDILERFGRSRPADRGFLAMQLGRWTLRLLAAEAPPGLLWRRRVLERGFPAAIPAYLWSRVRRKVW